MPVFDIRGWRHDMIEDTEKDLGFDVDPLGTPRLPKKTPPWKLLIDHSNRLESRLEAPGPSPSICCRLTSF